MRKPATIQTVSDVQPVEGADRIEVSSVPGWTEVRFRIESNNPIFLKSIANLSCHK